MLRDLEKDHGLVITLEDGCLSGGFGEKIASFYGTSPMRVKNYGFAKRFYDRYNVAELRRKNRLTKEQIAEDVVAILS